LNTPKPGQLAVPWVLADSWTIARRDFARWARQPGPVVAGLLFLALMVFMFGYLFGGAIRIPGDADYRDYLMPGMFAMTMLFGLEATMIAVSTDAARGVTDRFRSMPISPSAVVAGRSIADLANSGLGLVVMILCGLVVGWRAHGSAGATALAIGLLLLLRFAMLWVGIYLGLVVKGPESVVTVSILVWPVMFTASTFVPPDTMPGWLGAVAEWNPLSSTIAAIRDLFGNPGAGGESWIAQHALPMAIVWPVLLIAVFLPLSVHRYRWLGR
jgi:ABC-2 type transport system permease protein